MQWEGDNENSKGPQLKCRIWLHLPLLHPANLCPAFRGNLRGHLLQEALRISLSSFWNCAALHCYSLPRVAGDADTPFLSSILPSFIPDFCSFYSFILASIHPSVRPSVCPIYPFFYPPTHPLMLPSIHSPNHQPIHPFIHPHTHLSIHPRICHPPGHASIHPSTVHWGPPPTGHCLSSGIEK